jgi:hypothetical protein
LQALESARSRKRGEAGGDGAAEADEDEDEEDDPALVSAAADVPPQPVTAQTKGLACACSPELMCCGAQRRILRWSMYTAHLDVAISHRQVFF